MMGNCSLILMDKEENRFWESHSDKVFPGFKGIKDEELSKAFMEEGSCKIALFFIISYFSLLQK